MNYSIRLTTESDYRQDLRASSRFLREIVGKGNHRSRSKPGFWQRPWVSPDRETEMITRESFWHVYKPGCDEHLILHKIRKVKAFVKELDVVCAQNRIGNIIYSRARIINEKDDCFEVLCLGPVCVLPDYQ